VLFAAPSANLINVALEERLRHKRHKSHKADHLSRAPCAFCGNRMVINLQRRVVVKPQAMATLAVKLRGRRREGRSLCAPLGACCLDLIFSAFQAGRLFLSSVSPPAA
jgi:hypothetical protein